MLKYNEVFAQVTKIITAPLLWPLSLLYGALTSLRNFLYEMNIFPSYRSDLPVISVGNLSVGGNAKTPLCILIARELKRRGKKPVLLTRGYGSGIKNFVQVQSSDSSETVGDEALLLKLLCDCPVVICPDRVHGAKKIAQSNLGDLIILDDGFQHRRLKRNIDIITAFVGTPKAAKDFLTGSLLPFGRFRESRERGLRRAHMLVLAERTLNKEQASEDAPYFTWNIPDSIKVFTSTIAHGRVRQLSEAFSSYDTLPAQLLAPQPILAFCAIANPQGFFETLKGLGFEVLDSLCFRDHASLDLEALSAFQAKHANAPLVCTMKDATKLRKKSIPNIFVLDVDTQINPSNAFFEALLRAI